MPSSGPNPRRAIALLETGRYQMDDTEAVRALLDVYSESAYAKDVDRFMTMYAPEVRIFDLWGSWEISGATAWREGIAGWFGSLGDDRVVVEFDDVAVVSSGDLATITAMVGYSAESAAGDRVRQMTNRLTWVLSRTDAAWLVSHEHTSAPVDDATGKVILSR
jgi:uncharacterized protein (TIGR02246 family)